MATTTTTTIERYPWVLGAVVAGIVAALALILLTPGIAQAQSLNDEDAAAVPSTSAQGNTNNITQTTQVVQADEGASTISPQQQAAYYYEPAELRVVRPGDTLWSISEQRLQPNPTPEQVMNEVGRIYELNRNQIGDNPNLIFAGQQFLLPPLYKQEPAAPPAPVPSGGPAPSTTTTPAGAVAPSPSATTTEQQEVSGLAVAPKELPSTTVAPAQQQQAAAPTEPNTSLSNEQGLSSSDQPTTKPNEEVEEQQQTAASATEANEQPRIVPPWPAAQQQQQQTSEQQPTPAVPAAVADSIAQSSKELYESYVVERRLLGLVVIALTLGAALLMVWKLPMKRNVGDHMGWSIPRGGYYYEESSSSASVTPPRAGGLSSSSSTTNPRGGEVLGGPKAVASGASDATTQGQTDRASSSRREAGYLGPEENNNGEQASPAPAPPPARRRLRSAPPRTPYRGGSRRFH
jgi:hypothetical protein